MSSRRHSSAACSAAVAASALADAGQRLREPGSRQRDEQPRARPAVGGQGTPAVPDGLVGAAQQRGELAQVPGDESHANTVTFPEPSS